MTNSFPSGIMWNHDERDRRVGREVHRVPPLVRELAPDDTTTDETTTASRSAVPIVAVMIPGYGEVVERRGSGSPPSPAESMLERLQAAASVSQFQYSRRNELPSCRA